MTQHVFVIERFQAFAFTNCWVWCAHSLENGNPMRLILSMILATGLMASAAAAEMSPRDGWFVERSTKSYADLVAATRDAITANGLYVVTQAGPTEAAKRRGIEILGNTVIGAFNNEFALRVLSQSTAAMIEAPIRFYITENADGRATLSYKRPSFVFAPYIEESGTPLEMIAAELDATFSRIAKKALY
jgi:uncharacterized protein (DUF302 family)